MTIEQRQELKNKTNGELTQMLEDTQAKMKVAEDEMDATYKRLQQVADNISDYLKQEFNDIIPSNAKLEIKGSYQKMFDWDDYNSESAYKYSCYVRLSSNDESDIKSDDFLLNIYENFITMSTCSYGTFSRKKRPFIPVLIAIQGLLWLNEESICKNTKVYADIDALEENIKKRNIYYEISKDENAINSELKRREEQKEIECYIKALKNGAYYMYDNLQEDWKNEKRFYKIIKTSSRTVKMQDIQFSSFWPADNFHWLGDIHQFKLKGDVLNEMHSKHGKVVGQDVIDAEIAKYKAQYDERLKRQATDSENKVKLADTGIDCMSYDDMYE